MVTISPDAGAVSLLLLAALTGILAGVEVRRYGTRGGRAHVYWAAGLSLVGLTLAIEAVFYSGTWSMLLAQSYFFLVALLVGLLSLGSGELLFGRRAQLGYTAYVALMSAAVALFSFTEPIDASIINGGVVTGNPPLDVVVASTLLTVPAAAVMVIGSVRSALRARQWRLLSLAAGIIVISAAGGLYIVSVPITLYFAEFLGVFLIYVGFGGFPLGTPQRRPSAASAGNG